nr:putative phosphoglycerate mutase [Quercus suber]
MNKPKAAYNFEVLSGIFAQTEPNTDSSDFDFSEQNFGLLSRAYPSDEISDNTTSQWQRLNSYLNSLSRTAPSEVKYKLIYAGRHGQGFHNVAETFYGTEAWDDYWSKLDGNGTSFWSDSHLTETGEQQARDAGKFFQSQFTTGMPTAHQYYVSPLYRCLQTVNLTFSGLRLPADKPFTPIVKEMMREVMGEHTCDRRSSRSVIHNAFPEWSIEPGFSEEDELWQADHRETHDEHDVRTTKFLNDVFSNDESLVLSLTSHSGAIASLLRVVGHREFWLPTGALIPIMVKATRKS